MSRMDQFWRDVRDLEAKLPEVVHVVSGGFVSEVTANVAATRIVEGQTRLATPAEVESWQAEQARARNLAGAVANTAARRFDFGEKAGT